MKKEIECKIINGRIVPDWEGFDECCIHGIRLRWLCDKCDEIIEADAAAESGHATNRELELMMHTMGLNRGREENRNHFMAYADNKDIIELDRLVAKRFMARRKNHLDEINENYIYNVTEKGKKELIWRGVLRI